METAGWGSVNNLEGRTDQLKEVFMDVVNPQLCARYDYYGSKFTSNMMCAYKLCPKPCRLRLKTEDTCNVRPTDRDYPRGLGITTASSVL